MIWVYSFALILLSLAQATIALFVIKRSTQSVSLNSKESFEKLQQVETEAKSFLQKFKELEEKLIPVEKINVKVIELVEKADSLKAERARTAITQVEQETVEYRLRELEEIERELEASELENKQELELLAQQEQELKTKNEELKMRLFESQTILDDLLAELDLTDEIKQKLQGMQKDLESTQQHVSKLIEQIKIANDKYFILKRKYDALDIEYAQLYEKLSSD
jgi:chromosome segregation ATPase